MNFPKVFLSVRTFAGLIAVALAVSLVSSASAATGQQGWDGGAGNGSWSQNNNWGNDIQPAYGTLFFDNTNNGQTTMVDDNITSLNGLFWSGTNAWTLNQGGSTVLSLFDNSGTQAKIENQSTGLVTINLPITFAANNGSPPNPFGEINAVNGDITFGTGALTINGSSVNGIRMYGSGRTITFNNTVSASGKYFAYTGTNGNIINIGGTFTSGDLYVMNGGTLNITGTNTVTTTAVRLGGDFGTTGSQNQTKGATFGLTRTAGGQTFAGTINAVSGNTSAALLIDSKNTAGTNTLSGLIFLDSPLAIQQATGGVLLISNVIANSGTLTIQGSGTVQISNNSNTYGPASGSTGTTINSGATLLFGNNAAGTKGSLGAGDVVNNGTLTLNMGGTTQSFVNNVSGSGQINRVTGTGQATLSGNITGGIAITNNTNGVMLLSGTNTNSGTDTVSTGSLWADIGVGLSANANLLLSGGLWVTNTAATSNMTRAFGTGAGQIQVLAGGFGANSNTTNNVNIYGGATLTWGSSSFLTSTNTFSNGVAGPTNMFVNIANNIDLNTAGSTARVLLNNANNTTDTNRGNVNFTGNITNGIGTSSSVLQINNNNGGTTLLSGNNSFTGQLYSTGGYTRLNSANALPGGANPTIQVRLGTNGILELTSALSSLTFATSTATAGVANSLNMNSATVLGFNAIGTSASVTVTSGLSWSGGGAFAPSVFVLNDRFATGAFTLNSSIDLNNATRTIETDANTATINGAITSTGGGGLLTKIGAGTLALGSSSSSYSGSTNIVGNYSVGSGTGGTLSVAQLGVAGAGGTNSSLGASSNAASNVIISGATLKYTGNGESTDRLFTINPTGATLDASGAGAINFTNAGSEVAADAAGKTAAAVNASKTVTGLPSTTDLALGMTVSGTGIVGGTTIASIDSATQITLSAAPTAGTNVALTFGVVGRTFTLTGSNSGANTLASVLADSSGGGKLAVTKSGTGTWVLSGSNTYTGVTTLSSGVLSVNSLANGNSASNIGQASNAAANLVFSGGTLQYTGSTVSIDRNFTLNAGTTGTFDITNAGTNLSLPGATGTATNGGLTKNGLGTLTLTGSNTYTGATQINSGTLQIGNGATSGSLAATTISGLAGATLAYNRSDVVTLSGNITSAIGLQQAGSGTLILTGANSYSGLTTINSSGTLQIGNNGTVGTLGSGNVLDNGTLVLNRSDATQTFGSTISGSGAVNVIGTGSFTLTNTANSYTGGTSILGTGTAVAQSFATTLIVSGSDGGSTGALGSVNSGVLLNQGTLAYAGSVTLAPTRTLTIGSSGGSIVGATAGVDSITINGSIINNSGSNHLYFNTPDNTTVNGAISGGGDIVKANTGTLLLTNSSNSFGGANTMFIDQGTVSATASGAAGTSSGIINLGSSITGALNSEFSIGASGVTIANPINIRFLQTGGKAISGALGSGNSTYSGATSLSDHVSLNSAAGGTVKFTNVISQAAGTLSATPGAGLIINTAPQSGNSFSSSGPGVLINSNGGTGIVEYDAANTYTGDTVVQAGTLQLAGSGSMTSSVRLGNSSGTAAATINLAGDNFTFNRTVNVRPGSSGVKTISATNSSGTTNTYAGQIALDSNGTTLSTNAGATLAFTQVKGGDNSTGLDLKGFTLTVDGAGDTLISGTLYNSVNNGALTKTGAGTLYITGSSNTYSGATTINSGAINIGNGGTTGSLGTANTVTDNATLIFNRTDTVTLTPTINGSGALNILSGTVNVASGGRIGGAINTTISNGGTLNFSVNDGILNVQSSPTGTVTINSGGTLTSTNAITTMGPVFLNGGTLSGVGTSSFEGTLNIRGNVTVGGTTTSNITSANTAGNVGVLLSGFDATNRSVVFTVNNTTSAVGLQVDAVLVNGDGVGNNVQGTSSLIKEGAGTMVLSQSNTYTGATIINSGILSVSYLANGGAASGIGASTNASSGLVINGGTLQYTGTTGTTNRLMTIGERGATFDASGVGAITFSNTAGAAAFIGSGARSLTLTGSNVNMNTFGVGIVDNGGDATSLVKTGVGTWVISGTNNTYSGGTTISNGNLSVIGANELGTGTVNFGGGSISAIGSGSLTNLISTAAAGGVVNGNANLTFNGAISGGNGMVINNTGITTYGAANSYTGSTTVNAGATLRTAAAGSLSTTSMIAVNSGTLIDAASNSIGTSTATAPNLTLGSTLTVDDSGGAVTDYIGTLTLTANSTINLTNNGINSALNFLSLTTGGFTLTINNWQGTGGASGTGDQLFSTTSYSDAQLAQISFAGFGSGATQIGFGEIVPLSAVPEPGTIVGALLLAGFVGYRERRRVRGIFRG